MYRVKLMAETSLGQSWDRRLTEPEVDVEWPVEGERFVRPDGDADPGSPLTVSLGDGLRGWSL